MSQHDQLAPVVPLFSLFEPECIEHVQHCYQTHGNENYPYIPDELIGIFKIKFMVFRLSNCIVTTECDEIFMYSRDSNDWKRFELSFKSPTEIIRHISVGYQSLVVLLHETVSSKTRVFVHHFDNYTVNFGEKKTKYVEYAEEYYECDDYTQIVWYHLEDFVLEPGESVVHSSCSAFACNFITSHGRLLACGSNRFGGIAQPVPTGSNSYYSKIQACTLDPSNQCENPFFVKTVNGDHSIFALTKDHEIFYCGYKLAENDDEDLSMLRQLKRPSTMQSGEYFVDICSSYYKPLFLTSK